MKIILFMSIFCFVPLLIYAIEKTQIINDNSDVYFASTAVGLLGVSLIAAHLMAPESYSWQSNTLSELGAQHYDQAWIMRTGFISFGSLIAMASLLNLIEDQEQWPRAVPLIIYGMAMAGSGIYSAPPFENGIGYSENEAQLHSVYANVAGIALTTAMLGHMITEKDPNLKWVHLSGMAFVLLGSWLFKTNPEHQGLAQRALWAGSVTWLTWSFKF